MKLIYCKVCKDVIQLRGQFKHCKCGNVAGKFLKDNSRVEVAFYQERLGRVIGISNKYLFCDKRYNSKIDGGYFAKQKSFITKIPLHEDGNDIIVTNCKTFWNKNLRFIHWKIYKFMLNKVYLKVYLNKKEKYYKEGYKC